MDEATFLAQWILAIGVTTHVSRCRVGKLCSPIPHVTLSVNYGTPVSERLDSERQEQMVSEVRFRLQGHQLTLELQQFCRGRTLECEQQDS